VARKDLSRTVIEGGRYYHNSYFRRASHGIERATTREWIDRVAVELDEADASAPPLRPRVRKEFRDKLAPAHRWLVAQVGRPWSKVFSELCAVFDSRTVAGRHVVHDHMLQWVRRWDAPRTYHSRYDLVIDSHGILRKPPGFGRSWQKFRAEVLAWASGRMCANTYRGWWWFRVEPIGEPCKQRYRCEHRQHVEIAGSAYGAWKLTSAGAMSPGQVRYLERLPDDLRGKVLIASPLRGRCT
jgi:hypothetical protein